MKTAPPLPRDYGALSHLEWLETNGLGGYAAGTVAGANTRGYHGLLVAAVRPPVQRTAIVSTADEWLEEGSTGSKGSEGSEGSVYLSTHQFPGTVSPEGYRLIESFVARPIPTWVYRTASHRIERRLFMAYGANTTVVRYRLLEGPPVTLHVRPFFVFRDHHTHRKESHAWRVETESIDCGMRCHPSDGGIGAAVYASAGKCHTDPLWYRNFEHLREQERGLDYLEDAYAPFNVELPLRPGVDADIIYTSQRVQPPAAAELERAELARRAALTIVVPGATTDDVTARLAAAADSFLVVGSGGRHSVIAGYPWFTDWGRDTMIALQGLAIDTERVIEAELILHSFAVHLKDGLLPNRFPDWGEPPQYNTVDASLWYAVALRRLVEAAGGETPALESLTDHLEEIVQAYARGTEYGIHEDTDGLINSGADGVALTWMDARIGDWVVTPRRGKVVEINALWYNARRILADLLERQGRDAEAAVLRRDAQATRAAFVARFWDAATGSLFDVINPDGSTDASIRPNQLLAASLPYPLISREQAQSMVEHVAKHLLTPVGLRSLAPSDSRYQGRYGGDQRARDSAYHQGAVWPWLLGSFADALFYAYGDTKEIRSRIRDTLQPLAQHLDEACIGQISEIFEGDPPHAPRGAPAQAWSVAEMLRVWRKVSR